MADRLDVWERRLGVLANLVPYLALLLTTLLYLLTTPADGGDRALTLGLVGAACAWMLWWHALHPAWHARGGFMTVFFAGVLAFYALLGLHDPVFGFYSFAGYAYAADVLRGWRMFVGVLLNALIAAASLLGGVPPVDPVAIAVYAIITLFIVTVAMTFTLVGYITSEQSRRRKEMVAELAAAVEENARLHAQLLIQAREAGVLDERQRLAGEIHDTLAQSFTGIITQLQAVAEPPRHVGTALRLARDGLAEARRSVHALRPPPLEDANLPDALAEVAAGWTDQTGVPATVATTGAPRPLHPEVEVALLRTAQEALSNVAKHAAASRVGLTLSYMEDVVTLDVRDDGTGFTAGQPTDGYGLVGMRQRVVRLAGALEVESEPGAGTAVSASVPAIPAEVAR
ncbi:sensor histidine kinase [Saccharothrix obliqua]|uniref:sensor histidine kinase n=1 Tax=Saccharothrix obliqua TaxID=2861747 RepID=UPI0027E23622|nr:sensor histidine kinase [Saccharothrix obliqua]